MPKTGLFQIYQKPTNIGNKWLYLVQRPTVVKSSSGVLMTITVVNNQQSDILVYDSADLTNLTDCIAVIPASAGVYTLQWPCKKGITIIHTLTAATVTVCYT